MPTLPEQDRIFCYHHKGGVRKSTTAGHVAAFALREGRRVLLIDGDTERHAAEFFGVDKVALRRSRVELFDGRLTVAEREFGRLRQTAQRKATETIVVDLSPNLVEFAATVTIVPPTLVLLPVKVGQGALRNLQEVLHTVLRATTAQIKVVAIGESEDDIRSSTPDLRADEYQVVQMPFEPALAERSFRERTPMWCYPALEPLLENYRRVLEHP
jgi:cellulose biosynthesis protein BcsQ